MQVATAIPGPPVEQTVVLSISSQSASNPASATLDQIIIPRVWERNAPPGQTNASQSGPNRFKFNRNITFTIQSIKSTKDMS